MTTGIQLIAAERERQQLSEGWSPEHDDEHTNAALAKRAAELAAIGTDMETIDHGEDRDQWGLVEKHKGDRIRQLEIAGALIAAEIDRLQRRDNRTVNFWAEVVRQNRQREIDRISGLLSGSSNVK